MTSLTTFEQIMMKSRYLFPLIYVVVDACRLLFVSTLGKGSLVDTLMMPSGYLMQTVTLSIGAPRDPAVYAYFVGVGTILQMYLLGLVWEIFVDKIKQRRRTRVTAESIWLN
jgi:hypothetical protein